MSLKMFKGLKLFTAKQATDNFDDTLSEIIISDIMERIKKASVTDTSVSIYGIGSGISHGIERKREPTKEEIADDKLVEAFRAKKGAYINFFERLGYRVMANSSYIGGAFYIHFSWEPKRYDTGD